LVGAVRNGRGLCITASTPLSAFNSPAPARNEDGVAGEVRWWMPMAFKKFGHV
jgi:hypothetical protein